LLGFDIFVNLGTLCLDTVRSLDFSGYIADTFGGCKSVVTSEEVDLTSSITDIVPSESIQMDKNPTYTIPPNAIPVAVTLISHPKIFTVPLGWVFSTLKWIFKSRKKTEEEATATVTNELFNYQPLMALLTSIMSDPAFQLLLLVMLFFILNKSLTKAKIGPEVSTLPRLSAYGDETNMLLTDQILSDDLSLADIEDIYRFILTSLKRKTCGEGRVAKIMQYCSEDDCFHIINTIPISERRNRMVRSVVTRFIHSFKCL
jgi:hypothetical protein